MQDLTPDFPDFSVVKSGKPFDANFAMTGVAIQDGI
jgi:hypothetical protein